MRDMASMTSLVKRPPTVLTQHRNLEIPFGKTEHATQDSDDFSRRSHCRRPQQIAGWLALTDLLVRSHEVT